MVGYWWQYLRGWWRLWRGRCPECGDDPSPDGANCVTCFGGLVLHERRWKRFLWSLGD